VKPGFWRDFFAGWKPVCRQAGLALPPVLRRQRRIKPGCRARRTPSSVRASRRYVSIFKACDKLPSPRHSGQAGQAAAKDKKPRPPESKAAATTATTNDRQGKPLRRIKNLARLKARRPFGSAPLATALGAGRTSRYNGHVRSSDRQKQRRKSRSLTPSADHAAGFPSRRSAQGRRDDSVFAGSALEKRGPFGFARGR